MLTHVLCLNVAAGYMISRSLFDVIIYKVSADIYDNNRLKILIIN